MSTLSKEFRRQLENTVLKAREEAERGAAAALESYGVAEANLPGHLDEAGKVLRRKLRAHGRQVGDVRQPDDSQGVEHLVQECAYGHWHRMLFARYLAEKGFLIEPESGLDVEFSYCEEEGRRLGIDPWELASRFAQKMLPGIFRPDDPVLQLRLPAESRTGLTVLLAGLPREVFLADDSLGWVYQFWQTKRRKEVNESGVKIGADELSPVTQLFTEDYMVDFLLDNTLGAWWAGKALALNPTLAETAQGEEELRRAVGPGDCPWNYLRFIKGNDGRWTPAAGTFDGWPGTAKELKCLDPCMGSGHFVVGMFERLVALRLAEETLDNAGAVEAVIRDNLFGLEIDPRCTQIAAFSLALAAWRRVGHCALPAVHIACSGLAPNTREADWLKLAGDSDKLQRGMARLYRLFKDAPVLGSLINPHSGGDLLEAGFQELRPLLEKALVAEKTSGYLREGGENPTDLEVAVTAQGIAKAAEILAGQFTLVATNVPYLGRGKQDDVLKSYLDSVYSESKWDLATAFVERCKALCAQAGTFALVTPSQWCSGDKYISFRDIQIRRTSWNVVARLGTNAFETISGEVVNVILIVLSHEQPSPDRITNTLDLCGFETPSEKKAGIFSEAIQSFNQLSQLKNPDNRVTFRNPSTQKLLGTLAKSTEGLSAGDGERFIFKFWEKPSGDSHWAFLQSAPEKTILYCGLTDIVLWENGSGEMARSEAARVRGHSAWGKPGIVVAKMNSIRASAYLGGLFAKNCAVLSTQTEAACPALLEFVTSAGFDEEIQRLDGNLNTATSVFEKVPFDLAHWQKVAAEKYPDGLPKPFSSDPTQWLFNGHPKAADDPLQVAVARMVGYRWPRQTGSSFPDCPALGPDGLEKHADKDGVVCFSQARDEAPAATRLRALLADAYGAEWSHEKERGIIAATGSKAGSLEDWLVNDFFDQHCDLFHNRPFIWHIWDGRKDGFNVLVNYHKLAGPNGEAQLTLGALTHAYLNDWIGRQRDAVRRNEAGAEDRLAAALELQGELVKIAAGEPPYDLFIRWKPLHEQPEGWQPDINDGVRLNIRPFLAVDLSRGRKGCGLLRAKLNVKWEKDRGKEPARPVEDFPWFWKWDERTVDFAGGGEFDGNRWNDCHYTSGFKKAAREARLKKQ